MAQQPDLTKLDWEPFGDREESPGRRAYWNGLVLSIYSTPEGTFECYVSRPMSTELEHSAKSTHPTADQAVIWMAEVAADIDQKWQSWRETHSEEIATAERAIERVDRLLSGAA